MKTRNKKEQFLQDHIKSRKNPPLRLSLRLYFQNTDIASVECAFNSCFLSLTKAGFSFETPITWSITGEKLAIALRLQKRKIYSFFK